MSNRGERTRVYVGDLGSGGSKPELEKEFERYGPLKSVWVARNPPGFAFIEFEDPRDAEDAVKDMDGRRVCGVTIKCELAKGTSSAQFRPGGSGRGFKEERRGGGPPSIVSSRYRRSPPRYGDRRRSRSPYGRSKSPSPRRSRSRSPPRRGGRSPDYQRGGRSPSPYRRSPGRDRDGKYY
ncbi:serine/arginine-rich splicing factor 3-like isoform X2 [Halichondria panicea]|uniref:serine/arginine-rich splicing factor 3-like isoform X2 n=1 Tax=Halichondria panicea TaxID=6063 RepID=UPI00312B9931